MNAESHICEWCNDVVLSRLHRVELDTPDGYGWEGNVCDQCLGHVEKYLGIDYENE